MGLHCLDTYLRVEKPFVAQNILDGLKISFLSFDEVLSGTKVERVVSALNGSSASTGSLGSVGLDGKELEKMNVTIA